MVLATMLMVCGMKGFRNATCTRSAGHLAGVEVGPCATTARELYLPQDRFGQKFTLRIRKTKSGQKTPTKIGLWGRFSLNQKTPYSNPTH